MLLPKVDAHPRLKTASSGRGVCCVFSVCSSYTGVLLRGWWPAAVSPDCDSVRRSQGRRMTANPKLLRKRSAASATYLVCVLDIVHSILFLEMLLGMDPQKKAQRKPWSGLGDTSAWPPYALAPCLPRCEALAPSRYTQDLIKGARPLDHLCCPWNPGLSPRCPWPPAAAVEHGPCFHHLPPHH